jgi:hypothetical protein
MKPVIVIVAVMILCPVGSADTEEPQSPLAKGRTLKVPAANATPTPGAAEVIDSQRLAELARNGRIAAVGADEAATMDSAAATTIKPKGRAHWRSTYRKQRERINKLESRADDLEQSERTLSRQWLTAGNAGARAAIDNKLTRIREQRRHTASDLRAAKSELQRITRMARAEGATPDWFRGLR